MKGDRETWEKPADKLSPFERDLGRERPSIPIGNDDVTVEVRVITGGKEYAVRQKITNVNPHLSYRAVMAEQVASTIDRELRLALKVAEVTPIPPTKEELRRFYQ